MIKLTVLTVSAALAAAAATPAMAHTGIGGGFAFTQGLLHPLLGTDHVLAMLAVGLLAGVTGGRALAAYPAAFLGVMAVGAALALNGLDLPFVEGAILASIVAAGVLIASGLRLPVAAGAAICGAFAVAHGYAHGHELPGGADWRGYAIGFMVGTSLLLAAGGLLGRMLVAQKSVVRALGALVALAGVGLALV